MNTTKIINDLSCLMGLRIEKPPTITINSKSAPRRLIGQLVRQKYIPSYQNAPKDLKWIVEGQGDCMPDTSIHIIDLLGEYNSKSNEIIIYDLLIKLCSLQLDVDCEDLKAIVMLHELSHAITHRGLDSENKIWEYFDIARPEAKEYFAQIYTYMKLYQGNNESCLNIMDRLTETQPDVYQTYKESIAKPVKALNKELFDARRKIPDGFELYPEALRNTWKVEFDNQRNYERYVGHSSFHGDPIDLLPKSIYETEAEGTMFLITANKITIKSYDYSPSDDDFSAQSTMGVYSLISKNIKKIQTNATKNRQQKPLFCIAFKSDEYYLNLEDSFAHRLWGEIVSIISNDYPVLGKVLRGYEQGLA